VLLIRLNYLTFGTVLMRELSEERSQVGYVNIYSNISIFIYLL
jgi:hypothetical protein